MQLVDRVSQETEVIAPLKEGTVRLVQATRSHETSLTLAHLTSSRVQGVLVSNIARRDTRTSAASPLDPWLELEVADNMAKKGRQGPSSEGTWNEHVASVDIEVASGALADLTNMFHVFVDGQPYGPFQRVR